MGLLKTATKTFFLYLLLTGFFYPLFITFIAEIGMQEKATGSLLEKEGKVRGSFLIAQKNERPEYFLSRPSFIDYNPLAPSGGSNWGPISKKLKEKIKERRKTIGSEAPGELLYASGSGLDPHISLEAAYFQIFRVAKARGIEEKELKKQIDALSEGKQLGFIGPSYVNVLKLNQVLDDQRRR